MTEKLNLIFYAAGVKFRPNWKNNLMELTTGEELALVPEPDNKFDKNAVKIVSKLDGTHLGYVPAKTGEAAIISSALAAGRELKAIVFELLPEFEPWKALEVEVKED